MPRPTAPSRSRVEPDAPGRAQPTYYGWRPLPAAPALRAALRRGRLALPPHPPLTLAPYQWRALPTGDRNWRYQYQSLGFLRPLLASDDDRDWTEALRWLRAWTMAHRPGMPANPMAWYPHAAAVRALVLATAAARLLAAAPVTPADRAWLVAALERHVRFLADARHVELSNHGLTQALALVDAARMLQHADGPPRARRTAARPPDLVARAVSRLLRVVARGISAGGLHTEGAPGYHLYFLEHAADATHYLTSVLPARQRRRLDHLPTRLARMYARTWYLCDLDGRLPPVGDTEVAMPRQALARIRRRLRALLPRATGALPARAAVPSDAVLYDEEAGFAVFKDTRDRGRYLIFRIQDRPPAAHAHDDALSVVFQERGVDVFADGGKYSYNYDDPIRRHLVSRAAHNTAEPDGADGDAYVLARERTRHHGRDAAFAATAVNTSAAFTHRRTVRLPARGTAALRVVDEMRGPRGYLLQWHLGGALRLQPGAATARRARFASPAHGIAIELHADHAMTCTLGPAAPGDPPGWRSTRWGECHTCPVLLVRPRRRDASTYTVTTVVRRTARRSTTAAREAAPRQGQRASRTRRR